MFYAYAIGMFRIRNGLAIFVAIGLMAAAPPLGRADISRAIAAVPALKSLALMSGLAKGKEIADAPNPLAQLLAVIGDASLREQADAAVKPHGFADLGAWTDVARRIAAAYAKTRLAGEGGKLAKAVAEIEKTEFLSDKQKRKLIAALYKGADAVADAPEADVSAVTPMKAEIEAALR